MLFFKLIIICLSTFSVRQKTIYIILMLINSNLPSIFSSIVAFRFLLFKVSTISSAQSYTLVLGYFFLLIWQSFSLRLYSMWIFVLLHDARGR